MKSLAFVLCLLTPTVLACDDFPVPLSDTITVETCEGPDSADCIESGRAVATYAGRVPDSDDVLTIALPSSPWHLYNGEMRILTIEEAVAMIRPALDGKVKRIELIGSWTGVSPASGVPSLAERLSQALGGMPVKGEDGFLWLSPDGSRRTTRQAFTVRRGAGSYFVPKDREVMVSLAMGWPVSVENRIPEDDAEMRMRAAAGWEIFSLCHDKALAGFERAADKGSTIAAYNAAIIRLERNVDDDRAIALALLERATVLGDKAARKRLQAERATR